MLRLASDADVHEKIAFGLSRCWLMLRIPL